MTNKLTYEGQLIFDGQEFMWIGELDKEFDLIVFDALEYYDMIPPDKSYSGHFETSHKYRITIEEIE